MCCCDIMDIILPFLFIMRLNFELLASILFSLMTNLHRNNILISSLYLVFLFHIFSDMQLFYRDTQNSTVLTFPSNAIIALICIIKAKRRGIHSLIFRACLQACLIIIVIWCCCTMVQNSLITQHLFIHFPMSSEVSE